MSLDQSTAPVEEFEHPAEEAPAGEPRRTGRTGRGRRRALAERRRRRWPYLLSALVVLGGLWWVGWVSSVTLVSHVVVDSPRGISETAVREASGIAATDHVPAVDADLVRRNIMAALPAVETVEVRRRLPDTVTVAVTRRTPFAVIPSGGGYVVIDASGVAFAEKSGPGKLPVIQAPTYEGRQYAREVLTTLPADLLADVRGVSALSYHGVDLTLANGATVRWGSQDQAELKARVLEGLLAVKAKHYDVSAPMMPTTSG